ncbi:MAG: alpha-amylase [Meiothermus sp.]
MFSEPLTPHQRQTLDELKTSSGPMDEMFSARLERHFGELYRGLASVYPEPHRMLAPLLEVMLRHYQARSAELKRLDLQRLLAKDWFQRPEMIGYVCYTERFAGTFKGVEEKLDYLERLGVKYLHLMPFLKPRPAPNDGGYAVMDYRAVREDLGTMDDLERLAAKLRQAGISLCCDLVLNHVAQEHGWAVKARSGDPKYQNYFHMFPDRTLPDQYERTLPEIFPDFAPGNFTWDEVAQRWVWTTFNAWQWDLNWANPEVFLEFADLILWLANRGIEVFRLDAIAFIWKRMGTDCQNQPEVHSITQALRAVARIVAPAVLFKAEAIVAPDDLIKYLGQGEHFGLVSDTAYHNSLMVQIWSSLASRDTRLMAQALRGFPPKPTSTAWNTYLRCHDDIGWAIADDDAAAVGLSGEAHRRFLSDYYSGRFPGSHSRGLVFQENPRTGDRRISGSGASLAGLEQALEQGDARLAQLALERLLLGHAVVLGFGGIPLLYMGDELALLNDYGFAREPEHAADNRWVHRPPMDWAKAHRAQSDPDSIPGRMYHGLLRLIEVRKSTPHFHASIEAEILEPKNPHVFLYARRHPLGYLVALYNFSEEVQYYPLTQLLERGLTRPVDRISGRRLGVEGGLLGLEPFARLWLTQAD